MKFCSICDNFLIPKNKKLFCRVCEKNFEFDYITSDYIIVKEIKHHEKEYEPIIIKEDLIENKISVQDRKASEDFFQIN